MSRADRALKRALCCALVLGFGLLAVGPARAILAHTSSAPTDPLATMSLLGDGATPSRLDRWPTAVYDTAPGRDADAKVSGLPHRRVLTLAHALATAPRATADTAYVAISGRPTGPVLPGVGSVVTTDDVDTLTWLPAAARLAAIRYLTATDGAALGVVSANRLPAGHVVRVSGHSSPAGHRLLATTGSIGELVGVWAQQRPDLHVLLSTSGGKVVGPVSASPITLAGAVSDQVGLPPQRPDTSDLTWTKESDEVAVRTTVQHLILPRLDFSEAVVAPSLFSSSTGDGLFDPAATLEPTERGRAFVVAAHAAPPGSRRVVTTAHGAVVARSYLRPDGGLTLLVWNPGHARTVTVDSPLGHGPDLEVARHVLRVGAGRLTAMVLPAHPTT